MRSGIRDPFDFDGADQAETTGFAVVVWSAIAAVALLFATVALLYSLPQSTQEEAETQEIDLIATGSVNASLPGNIVSITPRTDLLPFAETNAIAREITALKAENSALRQSLKTLYDQLAFLSDRLDTLEVRSDGAENGLAVGARSVTPQPPWGDSSAAAYSAEIETRFGVEVGIFKDLSAARNEWQRLRAKAGLFADLDAVVTVRESGAKAEFRLVAGPFMNVAQATHRCKLMEKSGISCFPSFYIGQPIANP